MNKKKSLRKHTAIRMPDRYGIKYTQYVRDSLIHAIRSKQQKILQRISNNKTMYLIPYVIREIDIVALNTKPGPIEIKVVYDHSRKEIVTVLP